jgi:hypothetical protein
MRNKAGGTAVLVLAAAVFISAFLVYSGLLVNGKLRTGPDQYNYFKELAVSFMHGRLDIPRDKGGAMDDVSLYKGKYYIYWPPVPALVYMPITALAGGTGTHDNLVTAFFGSLNCALFLFLVFLVSKKYGLGFTLPEYVFISVFWAFGTVHFYMSMLGMVWFSAQVMGQTFLLSSFIFIMSGTSAGNLAASGICYGLSVYTRNDVVFSVFLIAAAYINGSKGRGAAGMVKDALAFFTPFIILSGLDMAYNAARYGNPFNTGQYYDQHHEYFVEKITTTGIMNMIYFPYNFFVEVLRPMPFSPAFPFFKVNVEGFGFLWASPVFLLFIPAAAVFLRAMTERAQKKKSKAAYFKDEELVLMAGAMASLVAVSTVIFLMVGTGWSQFAARYTLDFQAALAVFCLFAARLWRGRVFYIVMCLLLLLSLYVQYFGMRMYIGL